MFTALGISPFILLFLSTKIHLILSSSCLFTAWKGTRQYDFSAELDLMKCMLHLFC